MIEKLLGYGKIGKHKVMSDGSIRFCARIARANRDYKYANRDGSTRIERITTDELFKSASLDTLKMLPMVHPHAPEALVPANYDKYAVGSTGDVPIQDGEFLVVTGHIRRQDAIDAFNGGVRELSPGYYRSLSAPQADGAYYQLDRRYLELALVGAARGGRELRIDGDTSPYWQFDPDNPIADWDDVPANDGLLDRMIVYGRPDPPPIILPPTIMTKINIGKHSIEVVADSIDAAVQAKTEYEKLIADAAEAAALKTKLEATEKANTDSMTVLKAELDAAKATNGELAQRLADATDIKSKVVAIIQSAKDEADNLKCLTLKGVNTTAAKIALDNYDIPAYKQAIVKELSPSTDADSVETYYKAYVDGMNKDMQLFGQPNGVGGGVTYPTIGNFTLPTGIGGGAGASLSGYFTGGQAQMIAGTAGSESSMMPPDDATHGWM